MSPNHKLSWQEWKVITQILTSSLLRHNDQGQQNLIKSLLCHNKTIYQVSLESISRLKRYN